MSEKLIVPSFGESITEVTIERWLVNEGDQVSRDTPLVSLESEKATLEVPSPITGTVSRLLKKPGEVAKIGEVIAELEVGAAAAKATKAAASAEPQAAAPAQSAAKTEPASKPTPSANEARPGNGSGEVVMGPAARRLVEEHHLDARAVAASGPGGRLLKEDVARHVAAPPAAQAAATVAAPAVAGRDEELVQMTPIRRTIARRLVEATQTTAMLTTFNEVDMSRVMALRQAHQDRFTERYGIKLGFMSFFVKGVIEALKAFPAVNGEIRGDSIVYKNYYDIGVAVGSGKGLTVPVIRNADLLSFAQLEQAIADFGTRARDNKLKLEELQGGTFTISNGGIYGSMLSTPILNPPQSGILGMHNIQKRAVVVNDEVVVRPMMYLALTYDHRLVDGREAVQFVVRIKECVENPERILLEV